MQLILSGLVAFAVAAVLGFLLIPALRRLKFGQSIREEGPQWHQKKSGTPTMGGIIFIAANTVVALFMTRDIKMAAVLVVALLYGLIGFADDYIKIVKKRNLGLTAAQKFTAQLIVSVAFILFVIVRGENTDILIPFTNIKIDIGFWYLPLNVILMAGFVNSVNLTDGLDGLAGFSSLAVAVFFTVFAKHMGYDGIALLLAALCGGVAGFLIYNIHPAKVFMGDTGSLYLGGILCAASVYLGYQIILVICGLVFIIETLSVMIQVTSFKLTGKRVFKMSPIHHHFEMCGYKETKIVLMFTVATILLSALAFVAI